MPIYEYECTKCNTIFETLVSVTSDKAIICEKCGSRDVRKIISASGIKISSAPENAGGCKARGGFT